MVNPAMRHEAGLVGEQPAAHDAQNGRVSLNLGQKVLAVALAVTTAVAVAFGVLAIAGAGALVGAVVAGGAVAVVAGGLVGIGVGLITAGLLMNRNDVWQNHRFQQLPPGHQHRRWNAFYPQWWGIGARARRPHHPHHPHMPAVVHGRQVPGAAHGRHRGPVVPSIFVPERATVVEGRQIPGVRGRGVPAAQQVVVDRLALAAGEAAAAAAARPARQVPGADRFVATPPRPAAVAVAPRAPARPARQAAVAAPARQDLRPGPAQGGRRVAANSAARR